MGKMHYRAGLNQIPLSECDLYACLLRCVLPFALTRVSMLLIIVNDA